MKFRWIFFLLISCATIGAKAEQGCPPGQIPAQAGGNVTSCGPIPDGYYQQQTPAAPTPSGEWIRTWGAISVGSVDSTTIYGVNTGKLSKSEAEEDSLRRCSSRAGDSCKVYFTYYNQCVAIAEPQVGGLPAPSGVIRFISAATISQASSESSKRCVDYNKGIAGAKCKVIYTACTEPIFRQF